jgi:uncharacterized protein
MADHPHPIAHVEFPAHNPEAASKFYADLFGWKIVAFPEFNYYSFESQPGVGGGFNTIGAAEGLKVKAGEVIVYVNTDDIDASLAEAIRLGATPDIPKTEIQGQGWYATFRDPSGARVGLYTVLTGQPGGSA